MNNVVHFNLRCTAVIDMTNSNSAGVDLYYSTDDVPVYSFGWLALATSIACPFFNNNPIRIAGRSLFLGETTYNTEKN